MATVNSDEARAGGTMTGNLGAPGAPHERVALWCGCEMEIRRVIGHARASRLIGQRGGRCSIPTHVAGARVEIWEMLPPASWRR